MLPEDILKHVLPALDRAIEREPVLADAGRAVQWSGDGDCRASTTLRWPAGEATITVVVRDYADDGYCGHVEEPLFAPR